MWLSYYFLLLSSFFPMLFLLLIFGFVLFCSCILSTCAHLLWWMAWAYYACPTFALLLPFLGLVGLLLLFPAGLACWAWFLFLLSFRLLHPFIFCHYLLISSCIPFLLVIGLFCCWALFIKNKYQQKYNVLLLKFI